VSVQLQLYGSALSAMPPLNPKLIIFALLVACISHVAHGVDESPAAGAVQQGNKYVVEFSCVGDLTNPAGRAAHIEQCKEQYVTGNDDYLWIPEDHAVPGKSVSTATRTSDTVTFQITDCGMDEKGAYCDEYYHVKDSNGEPYSLGCAGYDWSQETFYEVGERENAPPSWPVFWTACSAHDIDYYDGGGYNDPNVQLAYTTGGPQFYIESKITCEPGVGEYNIYRYRLAGDDTFVPVKSFTETITCGEPYPTYRLESKKSGAATARLGALAATVLAVTMLSLL